MISILMVNFNSGDLVISSLRQVFALRGEVEFEVIVADNGSTDGSRERIEKEFPQALVLALGRNLGFGAANNRAAAIARGDSLLLLNSDAWPLPGALKSLVAKLDALPGLGLVCPLLFYPDGRPQFHGAPWTSVVGEALQMARNRLESFSWVHRLGIGWYTAACVLIRRQAFEQVGGFDEKFFLYFEDVDLCRRLQRAGWQMATVREARAIHIKGGSQHDSGPLSELEYRRGQLRYYLKHRPTWEIRFLWRRLQRKFLRLPPSPERDRLLAMLEGSPH